MSTKKFSLEDVYGLSENPLYECPTFVARDIDNQFKYCIKSEKSHIIVYGASSQGKTWMLEKYCPNFIRVGCDIKFTRDQIFKVILSGMGINVFAVTSEQCENFGTELQVGDGVTGSINIGHNSTQGQAFLNIDLNNQTEVILAMKNNIKDNFIVMENFHYLDTNVQNEFANSLRELSYHKIRVIIVGAWKEPTKMTSYVSDLSNRCKYIDIGDWLKPDLLKVVKKGNIAMNTTIPTEIVELFVNNSGYNIGIFKSLLKNYYEIYGIYETISGDMRILDDIDIANKAIEKSYNEFITSVLERIESLATQKKSDSKGIRYYIVKAILSIMDKTSTANLLNGMPFEDISNEVNNYDGVHFDTSNIKQELLKLHLREDIEASNNGITNNLIPLFYFDRSKNNGNLFILESELIAAKNYGITLNNILGSVEDYV